MIGISPYRPQDEICVPQRMDEGLLKYDVGEKIKGEIEFEVLQKSKTEMIIGIKSFSCEPNRRYKGEDKE